MPHTIYYVEDKELGRVRIRPSARARNIIFRTDGQGLLVTVPLFVGSQEVLRSMESMRPRLRELLRKGERARQAQFVTPSFQLPGDAFQLRWERVEEGNLSMKWEENALLVRYTDSVEWRDEAVQSWLVGQIEKTLMRYAKRSLPLRLSELASRHGFTFGGVSVRKTRSRWGSCSAKGKISLSLFTALLPTRLRDYVLLHELCHTREMNHSPRFHALLDKATDGQDAPLAREMRRYTTSIFLLRQTDGGSGPNPVGTHYLYNPGGVEEG